LVNLGFFGPNPTEIQMMALRLRYAHEQKEKADFAAQIVKSIQSFINPKMFLEVYKDDPELKDSNKGQVETVTTGDANTIDDFLNKARTISQPSIEKDVNTSWV
jgi:hypothetical protein